MGRRGVTFLLLVVAVCGCAGKSARFDAAPSQAALMQSHRDDRPHTTTVRRLPPLTARGSGQSPAASQMIQASHQVPVVQIAPPNELPSLASQPEELPRSVVNQPLRLEDVIESVYRSYPLLEAAIYGRDIAAAEHLAAHGGFDLKLKAASENGPLGFYETYRHSAGAEQPLYQGSTIFGGYRVGRGSFQPWYLERLTDDGGEFKAGVAIPLLRNRDIDQRRAALWRTRLGVDRAEPQIQMQRIEFVRGAAYAYWYWVSAGRRQQIAASVLQLAQDRNEAIRRQVETGDAAPPVLQDNRRLIVSREAKLIDAERKLQQAAIKLSLFLRDETGQPLIPADSQRSDFPTVSPPDDAANAADIALALQNRPDLQALSLLQQQLEVDHSAARNELLPDVQAVVTTSQDVGRAATKKDDKSQLEIEAGLFLNVPLQRRKARGKLASVAGKLGQVSAKMRMTQDKITAEVQTVQAALSAAYRQIERARESVSLANRLAEIERRKFELGESNLLSVNLRERQAAEAQSMEVNALVEYFTARADYQAVLATE